MYAQTSQHVRPVPAQASATRPGRETLQTRPLTQRAFIRSWEYIRPVRITVLIIRELVAVWMLVLTSLLVSAGHAWGWSLLAVAVAIVAVSLWVFSTAEKGWPVVKA